MNEVFDIPIFTFGPLVFGLFVVVIIAVIVATFRWSEIAPTLMMVGIQPLGIIITSMGLYVSHSVIYFVSFLALLALITNVVRYNTKPLGFDATSITLLLLTVVLFFGCITAPEAIQHLAWVKMQMFFALGLLPFMLGRSFGRDDTVVWKTVVCAAWFSALFSPYVAGIVLAGDYRVYGAGRFSGMGGPIGAGKVFGMMTLFIVAAIWRKGTPAWKRTFLVLGAIAALIVTFATNSRGPFLSLFFGLIAMFTIARSLSSKILLFIGIPVVFFIIFAILAPEAAKQRIVGRVVAGQEDISDLSTGRIYVYKKAFNGVHEAPIMGHGTASFGIVFGMYDIIVYPHNIFLEFLYENGIVGLVLFVIFLFAALRCITQFLKNNSLDKSLRGLYCGLFVHSLINTQFSEHFAAQPAFWFTCGLISGTWLLRQNKSLGLEYEG